MSPEDVMKSIEAVAPAQGLPIIGPRRGLILDGVVKAHAPHTILEVGTLVGYSAIRMARHLSPGDKVTCVEMSERMAHIARSNLKDAGLSDRVEVIVGDAKKVLPTLKGDYDMVFLDAAKDEYLAYLMACEPLL
ncbi:MAG TPA: class I SAM-dependent methyltransferase, partial [Nitrososphaerales archaeon]|nr:class I SAM-dependent methyltransferase [Nitrososphaerales archaeon]